MNRGWAWLPWLIVLLMVPCLVRVFRDMSWTRHDVDVFEYCGAAEAASIVPDATTSLGLLAHYSLDTALDANLLEYIRQLAAEFEVFVLLTNRRDIRNVGDLPANCRLVFVPNQGLDIGKWMWLLHNLRLPRLERLGLFNDTTFVVGDMRPFFDKAKAWDVWGMTSSTEQIPHIQSYLLVADSPAAAAHLLGFFNGTTMDHTVSPAYSKHDLVLEFELGLSRHMASRFELHAFYSLDDVLRVVPRRQDANENAVVYYWDVLLRLGCPLLKKLRRRVVEGPALLATIDPRYAATLSADALDAQTFLEYKWWKKGKYD